MSSIRKATRRKACNSVNPDCVIVINISFKAIDASLNGESGWSENDIPPPYRQGYALSDRNRGLVICQEFLTN